MVAPDAEFSGRDFQVCLCFWNYEKIVARVLLNLADLAGKVDLRPRPRTGLERSFESQGSVAGIPFLGLNGKLAPRRRDSRDGDSGLPTNRRRTLTVGRKWRRESRRTESSGSWWQIHDSGISSPRLNFRAGGLTSR
ncbi:hypothetical protein U1Q18_039705 [Sarracenia purpurea var. burkii]